MVEGQARDRQRASGCRRLAPHAWLVAALCLSVGGPALAADEWPRADPCAAWPGEPDPLPRTSDRDRLRARWASLRVRELSQAAQRDERDAPVRAHRLWRRVLCIDPANAAAAAGLARSPLVAVHRPQLVARGASEPAQDAWSDLARPLAIARRPAPRSSTFASVGPAGATGEALSEDQPVAEQAPPPDPVETLLEEVQEHVRAARYEEALARVERGRAELPADASPARAAELEVLSATAALALDRKAEAADSLRRALAAQPMLTLDPMQTPPKVRRAFDRVRAGAEP